MSSSSFNPIKTRRALWPIILASLAFHGLLLWAFLTLPAPPPVPLPERTIEVSLSALAPPKAPRKPRVVAKTAPKIVPKVAPKPRVQRVAPRPKRPEPQPKPQVQPRIVARPRRVVVTKIQPRRERTIKRVSKVTTAPLLPAATSIPVPTAAPATQPTAAPPVQPTAAPQPTVAPPSPQKAAPDAGKGEGTGSGTGAGEGSGSGSGKGSGAGSGTGSGVGSGSGSGEGSGAGSGKGSGAGEGDGSGSGSGKGQGNGSGNGDGKGGGNGSGDGNGGGSGGGGGGGGGGGNGGGGPFGIGGRGGQEGPRHIVYVLDISLSMEFRIERAERELRAALAGLQPGESFNIVAFYGRTRVFQKKLVAATPQNVTAANRFLDALRLNNGTNLERALTLALKMPDINNVVVITDGVPTYGEQNFVKLAAKVRVLNKSKARIATVGLVDNDPKNNTPEDVEDSFEAAKLLEQIARDSGGDFRVVAVGDAVPESVSE